MPLVKPFNQKMQVIPLETMINILCGNYDKSLATYKIIDCRFPYEYKSGHIIGAINMYTKKQCLNLLYKTFDHIKQKIDNITQVLILYSEYSTERSLNL